MTKDKQAPKAEKNLQVPALRRVTMEKGYHKMKYSAKIYSGGVYCGCGEFDTLDACFEFADDGFCDYVRIVNTETGQTIKVHFEPTED